MVRTAIYGAVVFWVGIFCPASSRQPVWASEADLPRLLVLRNGSILQGEITRQGNYYRVAMPRSEFQVPVGQVDICCRSLEEAYQKRRAAGTGSSADSHRQLAAWCLRHNMLDYATIEVRAARAIDPDYPGLKVIENHIAQASHRDPSPPRHPRPTSDPATSKSALPAQPRVLPQAVQGRADSNRVATSRQDPMLTRVSHTTGIESSPAPRGQPASTHFPRVLPQSEYPRHARTLQRGARFTTFEPRDPFDAEIFNRHVARANSGATSFHRDQGEE
jgi:hypothetical protein